MFIKCFLKMLLICCLALFLGGCLDSSEKKNSLATIKIDLKSSEYSLYFTGTIKPIQVFMVNNAQVEGLVAEKHFEYGDKVKTGQLLFVITSQQLSKNYQTTLSDYVKSKKHYADAQFQLNAATELKKLQIESEQDYATTQTQMFNAELDFAQSNRRLLEVLQDLGLSETALSKLDNIDPAVINQALADAPNSIKRIAPATGIALLPDADGGSKDNVQSSLSVGSSVKSGQTLVVVGDMSGVSILVHISQINIGKIKIGQKAIVTSDGFPNMTLYGYVSHIAQQASSDTAGGGSLPTFAVKIIIPKLTLQELDKVRVGMRAEVAFPLNTVPAITIPLSAVYMDQHRAMVKIIDSLTRKVIAVPVKIDHTNSDSVEIREGLKPGDEVVIDAAAAH
jgi:macrolide-specific efflux system membrane fusion protein